MRLRRWHTHKAGGLVDGIFEDVEPEVAAQKPGLLDRAANFFHAPSGQLAVRNGSKVALTLTDDAGSPANVTSVNLIQTYTPTGAIAIAHSTNTNKSYLNTLTSVPALLNKYAITDWAGATRRRPVMVEMFELCYLADADTTYATRGALLKFDHATGTFTKFALNLGGGSADIKPYCIEHYNGVLLAAGHDGGSATTDEPAILRASFLGRDPAATAAGSEGFTTDSWTLVGSKKQRITGLRSGRGLCLVAKANELWKITGAGQARNSWNYVLDQLDSTEGQGVANPYALEFADGYFFGLGDAGPWRSDGMTIESLVGPRRRSWRGINALSHSWVAYHPDRRAILFGVNVAPADSGRSATYPFAIWVWDLERDCWAPDLKFSADLSMVSPVRTTTVTAPTAPPVAATPTHGSASTSSVLANWVNGDATAQTEVWVKDETGGGAYVLYSLEAAGATSKTVSGLGQRKNYKLKFRHLKAGVYSVFSSEVDAYTRLEKPSPCTQVTATKTDMIVRSTQNAGTSDLILERGGVVEHTFSSVANGTHDDTVSGLSCGTVYVFRARSFLASWPAAIQHSDYSSLAFLSTSAC